MIADSIEVWEIQQHLEYLELLHAEIRRLNDLIYRAGRHWLALTAVHPIEWEGAIDSAMEAACKEIINYGGKGRMNHVC